ncbi:Kynurenine 3-monooxygenase [Coccomyxa sp. Obi]|nr:Kynurenine 3-monooxygenase [Coccomyxa sp. Obi]
MQVGITWDVFALSRSGSYFLSTAFHQNKALHSVPFADRLDLRFNFQGVMVTRRLNRTLRSRCQAAVFNSTLLQNDVTDMSEDLREARGKVVVVGAGPAGTLAAIYMAKLNYEVDVYEQRAMPDPVNRNLDRSYHLAMSHRGMGAVEKVGVDMSRFREFPYRGSLLRLQNGAVQEVFHEPISAKVLVERMELVRHIVDEAARLVPPGRLTFHWSHACKEVNVKERQVQFTDASGETVRVDYDLLVGADGVNSKVRAELQRQVVGFRQQWFGKMHRIDKFFHRVKPPPGAHLDTHRGELDTSATVLRFYYIDSPPPLSVGLFFIHNHADGSYSGGISFTRADYTDEGSGGSLRTAEDFEAAMRGLTMYPEEMRREIAEQFAERPWYTSGSTLVLSRLTAPRAVLLGDAAHAVSAAFGQGVNSALEDCAVLGDIVAARPDDLDSALERYERQRKPDAHALGTMDHQAEAFAGFRGKWNLSYWIFQTHLLVNGWLHRMWPQRFGDPNLVPMMTIQRSSYSAIYNRIKRPFFIIMISILVAALSIATKLIRVLAAR